MHCETGIDGWYDHSALLTFNEALLLIRLSTETASNPLEQVKEFRCLPALIPVKRLRKICICFLLERDVSYGRMSIINEPLELLPRNTLFSAVGMNSMRIASRILNDVSKVLGCILNVGDHKLYI